MAFFYTDIPNIVVTQVQCNAVRYGAYHNTQISVAQQRAFKEIGRRQIFLQRMVFGQFENIHGKTSG